MVLRASLIVGLGLVAFVVTKMVLQPSRADRPTSAISGRGTVERVPAHRSGRTSSQSRRADEVRQAAAALFHGGPGAELTLPPLSDYDTLALQSTAAEEVRAQIRTRVVRALSAGLSSCMGPDHWGDSRVLLVLKAAPARDASDALVVESLERLSVFSGSGLGSEALDCLRASVPIPFRVTVPQAASLPAGSVHVLVVLPGRWDAQPYAQ